MAWHDGLHPRISTELSQATSNVLAVISQERRRTGEVAVEDCNGAKQCTALKKGKTEKTGNCRLVFVTATPIDILEQMNILTSF